MNFIENIEIKNFKSIHHQKIEGCKKINVFIGYPNVGKSNLLEALSIFSVKGPNVNLGAMIRFEKLSTFFYNGWINEKSEVILNRRYRGKAENSAYKSRLGFQFDFDVNNEGFENIDSNPIPSRYRVKSFEVAEDGMIHEWNGTKEVEIEDIKRYEFIKSTKLDGKQLGSLKDPFGENIFAIISSSKKLHSEVQELFNDYNLELLFDSREQRFTILKRTQTGIFSIPYELVADTLQRLIFYKAAIISNEKTILLFEEPEAHMFPPYIKKLTADIIFDETNQFFITTHSPYVLDELILEAGDNLSVYLVDYKNGETKIYPLREKDLMEIRNYGVDLFFNIESYLKHGQVDNA